MGWRQNAGKCTGGGWLRSYIVISWFSQLPTPIPCQLSALSRLTLTSSQPAAFRLLTPTLKWRSPPLLSHDTLSKVIQAQVPPSTRTPPPMYACTPSSSLPHLHRHLHVYPPLCLYSDLHPHRVHLYTPPYLYLQQHTSRLGTAMPQLSQAPLSGSLHADLQASLEPQASSLLACRMPSGSHLHSTDSLFPCPF